MKFAENINCNGEKVCAFREGLYIVRREPEPKLGEQCVRAIVCVSESTFRPKCAKSGKICVQAFSRSPPQTQSQSPHRCRGKMRRSVAFVYEWNRNGADVYKMRAHVNRYKWAVDGWLALDRLISISRSVDDGTKVIVIIIHRSPFSLDRRRQFM